MVIIDQSGQARTFKPKGADRPLCGRSSDPRSVKDRARARHDRRIDHPAIDDLRRALKVGRDDAFRPGHLCVARHELFQHGGDLGRMNAQLAAGAADQGLATLALQSLTIIHGEGGSIQRRRLCGRAAGDRQPTEDMLGQPFGGRGAKIKKEVGRPKRKLANKTMGGDLARTLNAPRGLDLGENLYVVAKSMGQDVKGLGAFDLWGAKALKPKLGHGGEIGVMPGRAFAIASDKGRNLQIPYKAQILTRLGF